MLTRIAGGLTSPVAITTAPGDPGRLFVTEQTGRVRIIRNGALLASPFLDIADRISCCGERGLLSVAFHPAYQANGYFFVNYTGRDGSTSVSRFKVSASDPDRADASSEVVILTLAQPFANHNGGQLQFGPDGYLYIGTGDGGSGGDPQNHAQNPRDLLGKMLRIDIDSGFFYHVPPTNPVLDGERSEIWAIGLRNPWRFSFDMATGDLYIADVGQSLWEEIDYQPASSAGGENYGWNLMEASHCYKPATLCDDGSLVKPILEYSHSEGCSVTGGYVHRGRSGRLYGSYLYGDFCSGFIRRAKRDAAGSWSSTTILVTGFLISSFGQDASGEVYVADYGGTIYRIDDTRLRLRPARPGR
ncbi:MAG: PQQ-dependent sugar dehydrogenase [Thermoanaerobaculia bacterium]